MTLIRCGFGLGNRVAAIAQSLALYGEIRFAWRINEHCPLELSEVFPHGIEGVEFVDAPLDFATFLGDQPAYEWGAGGADATEAFRRVVSAIGPQAWPDAPAVALVCRFHRVRAFDIPSLANAAGRAAHQAGEERVFLLADRHREDLTILLRRLWNIEVTTAAAPELEVDLKRSAEDTRLFLRDWQTALTARHIIALDGPTSLLHPARAQRTCISYA